MCWTFILASFFNTRFRVNLVSLAQAVADLGVGGVLSLAFSLALSLDLGLALSLALCV